jgi:hypothetical protein
MAKTKTNKKLREWAKFFAGATLADMATGIWLAYSGLIPLNIGGWEITEPLVYFGIAFDFVLFIILVHYAWHPKFLEPNFSHRSLMIFIGLVTGVVAVLHISRLVLGLEFQLGDWSIPVWLSWMGAIITAFISYSSFHFLKK